DFESLRFSARQGRCRLAEPQIAETDGGQQMQPLLEPWRPGKKGTRFVDRHAQDLRNRLASVANRQDFWLETAALATFTGRVHVLKKVHFQFFNAGAFTALAS